MRILEFEKLFQAEPTLGEALKQLKEDFEKVDYWANILKSGLVDNPEEANKSLGELTGTYSNLRTALAITQTEKRNREVRKYNQIKIETENNSKKFVSASADKEASESVAEYRRIRNIVLGYKEACEKCISSLQSMLKDMTREKDTMQKGQ
jgi:hypothetical protein